MGGSVFPEEAAGGMAGSDDQGEQGDAGDREQNLVDPVRDDDPEDVHQRAHTEFSSSQPHTGRNGNCTFMYNAVINQATIGRKK